MQVRVLPFGVLKDRLGASHPQSSCPMLDGTGVSRALEREPLRTPAAAPSVAGGIAVSVNAEFATGPSCCAKAMRWLAAPGLGGSECLERHVALTSDPIRPEESLRRPSAAEDGAVVVFDGIVRNHSRGRQTLYLDYEAFHELALRQMKTLVEEAIRRFGIRDASIVHRLGRVEIGETSVLIVAASAHRAQAFRPPLAHRLAQIHRPHLKKENFADGAVWAAGEPFPRHWPLPPRRPGMARKVLAITGFEKARLSAGPAACGLRLFDYRF